MTSKKTYKKAWQTTLAILLILLLLPLTVIPTAAAPAGSYIVREGTTLPFATLQEGLDAAQDGETVYLEGDITTTEIITIEKDIVLDGNGYGITSTAERVLNISGNATVKNLDIVGTNSERGINIIQNAVTVTIENVSVDGISHYALNVTKSAAGSTVTVKNSQLTAWGAVNLWGEGTSAVIVDSALTGINKTANEAFGVVVVNDKSISVKITGKSEIIAQSLNENAPQDILLMNDLPALGSIPDNAVIQISASVKIRTVDGQSSISASGAVARIGKTYYNSLQDAVNAASTIKNIHLVGDVHLDNALIIDKDIVIYGNRYSIIANGGNMDRIIDITAPVSVTLKDLTLDGIAINKAYARGINVGAKAQLTLNKVGLCLGNYYALNLNSASGGSTVIVKDSLIYGWAAVNIWATGSTVDIENSLLVGKNVSPVHPSNRFGVLVVNEGTHSIKVHSESAIQAPSEGGSEQQIILLSEDTVNTNVILDAVLHLDSSGKTLITSASGLSGNTLALRAEYAEAIAQAGLYTAPSQGGLLAVTSTQPVASFTVAFNTNGGSAVASQSIVAGGTATLPQAPVKEGYQFAGWYTDAELTQAFNFETAVTEDTVLYAKWTAVTPQAPSPSPENNNASNTPDTPPAPEGEAEGGNGWVIVVVVVAVVLVGGGCLWFFVFKKKS